MGSYHDYNTVIRSLTNEAVKLIEINNYTSESSLGYCDFYHCTWTQIIVVVQIVNSGLFDCFSSLVDLNCLTKNVQQCVFPKK